jgi:hypothetical protein
METPAVLSQSFNLACKHGWENGLANGTRLHCVLNKGLVQFILSGVMLVCEDLTNIGGRV